MLIYIFIKPSIIILFVKLHDPYDSEKAGISNQWVTSFDRLKKSRKWHRWTLNRQWQPAQHNWSCGKTSIEKRGLCLLWTNQSDAMEDYSRVQICGIRFFLSIREVKLTRLLKSGGENLWRHRSYLEAWIQVLIKIWVANLRVHPKCFVAFKLNGYVCSIQGQQI